jgi:hypothetical protein
LNFTPSSTDEESAALAVVGVADDDQIVHPEQPVADGVTTFEATDCGPVPTAFVAATLNVYAVPFVSPPTVTDVAGGFPVTEVAARAVDPEYGVTV